MKSVVVFGNHRWAEVVSYYLTRDSAYDVAGFTVDQEYVTTHELLGRPVVPFEHVEERFPPSGFDMLVSLGPRQMNRLRADRFRQAQDKGYALVTYVSSKAITWPDLAIGANCLIAEGVVIQPYARIGCNVTIGVNAVIGHHTSIGDHAFIGPGAVILGGATVGAGAVIGATASVREGVRIGEECLIGMGVCMTRNAEAGQAFVSPAPERLSRSAHALSGWMAWTAE